MPSSYTYALLKVLPRGATAKIISKLSFTSTYRISVCGFDLTIQSGPQDDHFVELERDLLKNWESETLRIWKEFSRKGGTCVDVGAYLGIFSIISAMSGARQVIALEPNVFVLDSLRKNLEINGVDKTVQILSLGASNEISEVALLTMPNRPRSSGAFLDLESKESIVYDSGFRKYEGVRQNIVKVSTLDNVLAKECNDIEVIKIDVEGYEMFVIEGANRILREQQPSLIIEIVDSRQKAKMDSKLAEYGYSSGSLIIDKAESRNYLYEAMPEN